MSREVKRVPVDFDWPLKKVWSGYQRTEEERGRFAEDDCPDCTRGYSERGQYLHDLWYGHVPFRPEDNGSVPLTTDTPAVREFAERNVQRDPWFYGGSSEYNITREARRLCDLWNGMWCHHLNQDDVDALIEAGRLMDFTHHLVPREDGKGSRWEKTEPQPEVTAEMVNEWSIRGFGHDSINAGRAVEARCQREGVSDTCATCGGHASLERYPGQREEAEKWERTEPPTGEGWQLWETVSEGSPISPVFPAAELLALWLTTEEGGRAAGARLTLPAARKFVEAGWAPTGFDVGRGYQSGVELFESEES